MKPNPMKAYGCALRNGLDSNSVRKIWNNNDSCDHTPNEPNVDGERNQTQLNTDSSNKHCTNLARTHHSSRYLLGLQERPKSIQHQTGQKHTASCTEPHPCRSPGTAERQLDPQRLRLELPGSSRSRYTTDRKSGV